MNETYMDVVVDILQGQPVRARNLFMVNGGNECHVALEVVGEQPVDVVPDAPRSFSVPVRVAEFSIYLGPFIVAINEALRGGIGMSACCSTSRPLLQSVDSSYS